MLVESKKFSGFVVRRPITGYTVFGLFMKATDLGYPLVRGAGPSRHSACSVTEGMAVPARMRTVKLQPRHNQHIASYRFRKDRAVLMQGNPVVNQHSEPLAQRIEADHFPCVSAAHFELRRLTQREGRLWHLAAGLPRPAVGNGLRCLNDSPELHWHPLSGCYRLRNNKPSRVFPSYKLATPWLILVDISENCEFKTNQRCYVGIGLSPT